MKEIRIYADFNGLVNSPTRPGHEAVVLDTLGSARDLANAGVTLHDGLALVGVDGSDDEEDLEGHGVARFDEERNWWVIDLDEIGVRYVPASDRSPVGQFLCVSCRKDLGPAIAVQELALADSCPECGTPILAPLAEPTSE